MWGGVRSGWIRTRPDDSALAALRAATPRGPCGAAHRRAAGRGWNRRRGRAPSGRARAAARRIDDPSRRRPSHDRRNEASGSHGARCRAVVAAAAPPPRHDVCWPRARFGWTARASATCGQYPCARPVGPRSTPAGGRHTLDGPTGTEPSTRLTSPPADPGWQSTRVRASRYVLDANVTGVARGRPRRLAHLYRLARHFVRLARTPGGAWIGRDGPWGAAGRGAGRIGRGARRDVFADLGADVCASTDLPAQCASATPSYPPTCAAAAAHGRSQGPAGREAVLGWSTTRKC